MPPNKFVTKKKTSVNLHLWRYKKQLGNSETLLPTFIETKLSRLTDDEKLEFKYAFGRASY